MKSGLHFCFTAPTSRSVDAFHAAAVQSGGRDNGKPGLRADYGPGYYAAFVIDPDGYRLEAHCQSAAP
jgi:predicted lactoylglutathione lyase